MSTIFPYLYVPIFSWPTNPGGLLYTYAAGGTTPQATYSDDLGAVPNTNPVVLDSTGSATVRLDPTLSCHFVLKDPTGVTTVWDADNYTGFALTATAIGAILYPQTPAEAAAGVTPVNFSYVELDPRRYGIDTTGATDSTANFAKLASVAAQYPSVTVRLTQNGKYRLDGGFPSYDCTKIGWDLQGSTLDFSHMTSGTAITPIQTGSANVRLLLASAHPFQNGYLLGPGVATAVNAILLTDGAGFFGFKGVHLGIQDFQTDVTFGSNASFCSFFECSFTLTAGAPTTYSVVQTNTPGERNSLINCNIFNKPYGVQNLAAIAADLQLIDCSIDYFTTALQANVAGTITMIGGHFEANTDTANWAQAIGSIAAIYMNNVTINVTANKTVDIFYSDPSCSNGGIFLRDCTFYLGAHTFTGRLIGGGGNALIDNLPQFNSSVKPVMAAGASLLAYGGFENANYTAEWTLAGATPAVRSNTQSHNAGAILTTGTLVGGSLYTAGTYINVPLTGGAGTLATATIIVAGGAVTNVYVNAYGTGSGYVAGNTLSAAAANIGGTGSGFTINAATVSSFSLSFPGATGNQPSATAAVPCKPGQYLQGEYWDLSLTLTGTGATFASSIQYLDKGGNVLFTTPIETSSATIATWTRRPFYTAAPAPFGTVSASLAFTLLNITTGPATTYVDDVVMNVA